MSQILRIFRSLLGSLIELIYYDMFKFITGRPVFFFLDKTDRAFVAIYELYIVYNIVVGSIERAIDDRSVAGYYLYIPRPT